VFPISRSTEKLSLRRDLKGIRPRARRDLPFIGVTAAPGGPLMLDTGVYIHGLKGQTPTAHSALRHCKRSEATQGRPRSQNGAHHRIAPVARTAW